jgi:hypothetical protein
MRDRGNEGEKGRRGEEVKRRSLKIEDLKV